MAGKKKEVSPAPETVNEEKTKKSQNLYVLEKRSEDNMWQVKRRGSDRAIKLFKTKDEASTYVKQMAQNQGINVVTRPSKGKNKGKIQKF